MIRRLALRQVALGVLVLLAFTLPFEWAGIPFGPLQITNLEILVAVAVILAAVLVWREQSWRRPGWIGFPRSWWVLLALFVAALFLSAIFAPDQQANAFKAAIRSSSGLLLAIAVPQIVRRNQNSNDLRWAAGGLVAGAAVSLAIGMAEIIIQDRFIWLDSLRLIPTQAGPFIRLSATFNHANQAAMYLEATWPLLAAFVWEAGRQRKWVRVGAGGVLLFMWLLGSIFTYSRSSYVTIIVSGLFVALVTGWRARGPLRRMAVYWAGVAGFLVVLVGVNLATNPVMRLRLQSEQDNEWYLLQMDVPAELTLPAGETITPTLTIVNDGLLTWRSRGENPINVGARWFLDGEDAARDAQLAAEPRWPLPETVRPGEEITIPVPLQAPIRPGTYRLEWDLVQEGIVWFSEKNGTTFTSQVTIEENSPERMNTISAAGNVTALSTIVAARPSTPPIPGRSVLWPLAGRMLLENPVSGIGLDNFRLLYGPFNGQEIWNDTVTTNNWYIETLVSLGIAGSFPFFAWLVLLSWDMVRRLRRPFLTIWLMALTTALLAYLIHGLLDYFLLFYNTGLLFWLLTGLWVANRPAPKDMPESPAV